MAWDRTIVLDLYWFDGQLPGGQQQDRRFLPFIDGLVVKSGGTLIRRHAELYRLRECTTKSRLYVCGHGDEHKVAGMDPDQLAEFLISSGLSEVGYIHLASCGTAIGDKPYALKLQRSLFASRMHIAANIAGRTGYIRIKDDGSKVTEVGPEDASIEVAKPFHKLVF